MKKSRYINVVEQHGGEVIMTSAGHQTGTDRIVEAAQDIDADIIVNVQGDEALVNPFNKRNSPSDIKAVLNEHDEIMYLSRSGHPVWCKS